MLLRAFVPAALLALTAVALPPAASLDGATVAYGLGLIEVFNSGGQLVCTDTAPTSVSILWAQVGERTVPTGHYESVSVCASFVYPIAAEYECTGAPGGLVRCDENDPPRWFELYPDGWFVYERDNLGIHFEVTGWLERSDAAA